MIIEKIFGELPELETKRLILRKMTLDDARNLFEYASDSEMTEYVMWNCHRSIKDSEKFLKSIILKYENKKVSPWGIVYKENNKFIGTCGYLWWSIIHSRAEIAFELARKYWNTGLMTEAVKRVIQFGFKKMTLYSIEARCMVNNIASQNVLENVGMTCEVIRREKMLPKTIHLDVKIYSIY